MIYDFTHLDRIYSVRIEKSGDSHGVIVDNTHYEITDFTTQQNAISFRIGDRFHTVHFALEKEKVHLVVDGDCYTLALQKKAVSTGKASAAQKGDNVSSPMPGLIVKIPLSIGVKVKAGTTLAIVEAMKMQNELRAPRDGVIKKINYSEGAQVDAFQPIVELESE